MSGPRRFTPTQSRENEAFPAELCRTGNVREAARRLGAHRAKFTRRRARHPEFAALCEAALDHSQEILGSDREWNAALHRASRNLKDELSWSVADLTQAKRWNCAANCSPTTPGRE